MEVRKAVYCADGSISIDAEFNEVQEMSSRHLLCYGESKSTHDAMSDFTQPLK